MDPPSKTYSIKLVIDSVEVTGSSQPARVSFLHLVFYIYLFYLALVGFPNCLIWSLSEFVITL